MFSRSKSVLRPLFAAADGRFKKASFDIRRVRGAIEESRALAPAEIWHSASPVRRPLDRQDPGD
ncbi:hypothetical protein M529_15515 [Sphingobium ummariense RL-3]|uniref:Uncharacterized protein n=1 Tax=Sphingobium ummariense RL-3 TaxID=1346791 RepID=T0K421_9SPHN|nr:hypothetical protein M529_15515 [Sphingobium ummariense RL-3]